jgi:hypothetical protein
MVMVNIYTEDDKGHNYVYCSFELTGAQLVVLEKKAKLLNLAAEEYLQRLLRLRCSDA